MSVHRWALSPMLGGGDFAESARCEACGLYVVAGIASWGERRPAPVPVLVVAGRYINGGLHATTREPFDAAKHTCRAPAPAPQPDRCLRCGNAPGEGAPWCSTCRGDWS